MNSLRPIGMPVAGLGICETCGNPCGSSEKQCGPCKKKSCACPEPFLDVDKVQGKTAVYRVNDNGKTAELDLLPGIQEGQTDTSLVADVVNRILQYSAERHTDSITAQELGAILHLNDLGDVSTKGAENGSTLVYKKTNTCGQGCVGTGNEWVPWNALDEDSQVQSMAYPSGYDGEGNPVVLQQPASPSKQYLVAWDGANQVSYVSPAVEVTAPPAVGGPVYFDETTGQLVYVRSAS